MSYGTKGHLVDLHQGPPHDDWRPASDRLSAEITDITVALAKTLSC